MSYYIWQDNQQSGPFSLFQLRQMWAGGEINLSAQFSSEDNQQWQPISDLTPQLEASENPPAAQTVKVSNPLIMIAGCLLLLLCPGISLIMGLIMLASPPERKKGIILIALSIVVSVPWSLIVLA